MYHYHNANTYGNNIDDCVIRAISTLTDKSWRETYDELTYLAGNEGLMFENVEFVEEYLDERYQRQCHYSKKVGEFCEEYPKGRYAVTMQGHITAIIDGCIIDTFDPSERVMRCAWYVGE